jgi:aerobic carbon-monoxide dehydrogenase medium subunit
MAVLALGGSVGVRGPGGTRRIPADDFFTGFFETSLAPGELLADVRVPRRPGLGWGYQKFVRRANDWAIVGVAAADGRIALANMGPVPLRATAAERALADGATAEQAAAHAAEGTEPAEDLHADRAYRQHLARVLTRRALEQQT